VRHISDGVFGRIVWANAASVKIQWDDGEKVTWKRAELGIKGLAVVQEHEGQPAPAAEEAPATEPAAEPVEEAVPAPASEEAPAGQPPVETTPAPESQPAAPDQTAEATAADSTPAKKRKTRSPKTETPHEKKPSALDPAARVLAEEHRSMGCQELIGAMAMKGYWTSPGGKTPAATLYSALLREMDTKGDAARFVKVGRGQFALRPQA
jgi:outer membrane biosynthesis protein TonB